MIMDGLAIIILYGLAHWYLLSGQMRIQTGPDLLTRRPLRWRIVNGHGVSVCASGGLSSLFHVRFDSGEASVSPGRRVHAMGSLPLVTQRPFFSVTGLGSPRGSRFLIRGLVFQGARDYWRYDRLREVPAFSAEGDLIGSPRHGWPFPVAFSPVGELGPFS